MLTEFEVRRRMEIIRASRMAPGRKARMLLRLGRALKFQMRSFSKARARIAQTADRNAAAGLARMAMNAEMLHDVVRTEAITVLRRGKGPTLTTKPS